MSPWQVTRPSRLGCSFSGGIGTTVGHGTTMFRDDDDGFGLGDAIEHCEALRLELRPAFAARSSWS